MPRYKNHIILCIFILFHAISIVFLSAQEENNKKDSIPDSSTLHLYSDEKTPLPEISLNIGYTHSVKQKKNIFNSPYSGFIIPTALITYGVVAQFDNDLRRFDLSLRREVVNHKVKINLMDDYTQFAPVVLIYGLDAFGVKAKHDFIDHTIILASSYLITAGITQVVKRATHVERPNGSAYTSFPSGHTATVFVGAHILFKEYKDVSPWIGIAGYALAANTGILRVMNNRHWFSDVVAGAGVGILSAELGYLLLPVVKKLTGKKNRSTNLTFSPILGNNHYEIGLGYSF
ncbi:phosphatase PAP2 family protein [Bacteroidales bacterium OttesenSCG-928-C19]|nr:phosphatase PAP2 family protein [Bacteroidales bacterium OttesenSCG-928-C19]